MVNCVSTHSIVAAGAGYRLYDGIFYSYPAGHCRYHCAGQNNSGAKTSLKGRSLC